MPKRKFIELVDNNVIRFISADDIVVLKCSYGSCYVSLRSGITFEISKQAYNLLKKELGL